MTSIKFLSFNYNIFCAGKMELVIKHPEIKLLYVFPDAGCFGLAEAVSVICGVYWCWRCTASLLQHSGLVIHLKGLVQPHLFYADCN